MTMKQSDGQASWLLGITSKRSEVANVLIYLVEQGIKRGVVTAETAHCIPVEQPNSRGAAAKYLRKVGFEKGAVVVGTTEKSHAHWLCEWRLVDHGAAQRFLDTIKAAVLSNAPVAPAGPFKQGDLL